MSLRYYLCAVSYVTLVCALTIYPTDFSPSAENRSASTSKTPFSTLNPETEKYTSPSVERPITRTASLLTLNSTAFDNTLDYECSDVPYGAPTIKACVDAYSLLPKGSEVTSFGDRLNRVSYKVELPWRAISCKY